MLLEASPPSLTRRMQTLQSRLTGDRRMVLGASPTASARRWKAAAAGIEPRLWALPFATLRYRAALPWGGVRLRLQYLLPFFEPPLLEADRAKTLAPLYCGRVLYLRGKLVPGKMGSASAMSYYNIARPSNEQLATASIDDIEKAFRLLAKLDAGYWSGLINFQRTHDRAADRRENYQAAAYWFDEQTLQAFQALPSNRWASGAQYNLARTYEALGDIQHATLQVPGPTTPRPATRATCSAPSGSNNWERSKRRTPSRRRGSNRCREETLAARGGQTGIRD